MTATTCSDADRDRTRDAGTDDLARDRALDETSPDQVPAGAGERRPGPTGDRPVARVAVVLAVVAMLALGTSRALADGDGVPAPPGAVTAGWVRPVPGEVARPFDPPAQDWSAGHRGVDLAAGADAAVRSPTNGTLTFAGAVAGKPVVVVAHPGGLRSTFEPAVAALPRGSLVTAGQVVARTASAGASESAATGHCTPGVCLHWGVLRGQTYLDPLLLLGDEAPIVLLPTG
jgi:murein DD-endopeptidase MepM/ murein hydrolase activator NlpD